MGMHSLWSWRGAGCFVARLKRVVAGLGAVLAAGAVPAASAASVASVVQVTPQGEVSTVTQVVLRFSEAVLPLGDLRRPAPVSLACQGAVTGQPEGSARWSSDREWLFDLRQPLPPGVRCELRRSPEWKPLNGDWSGPEVYRFSTGGPAIKQLRPWPGSTVEEEPLFIAELTGAVAEASVRAHAWCEVEGLGERLPVTVLGDPARAALLQGLRLDRLPAERLARTLVLGCGRPLPTGAKLRLVWGKGITVPGQAQAVTTVEQRYNYQVRPAFTAEFTCEREKASSPCMPIRPLALRFSAPVARALAAQVRLQPLAGGAALAPVFGADDKAESVSELRFASLLPERAHFRIELPGELKDVSGRLLANRASFPLEVATGEAPPIAKFAAAPFGVVEWKADALLPLTLRHVQADLRTAAASSPGGGQVRIKHLASDADVIRWFRRLQQTHETSLTAEELGLPREQWLKTVEETDGRGRAVRRQVPRDIATREISLLAREADVQRLALPQLDGGDPRPFEVVGLPLSTPGYQVVEVESQRLGRALLDKPQPMYVRTGVLLTNLGVHFKQGRENSVVWVTSLDRGRPVAGADVAVSDCTGKQRWAGRTDASGLARVPLALEADEATPCNDDEAFFVSARKADARGVVDMAFVVNGWSRGIEPWRFNLPTATGAEPDWRAHTVFDRTLLRAGETVAMKHFVRNETAQGLALVKADELPTRLRLVHEGSGDEVLTQTLVWKGGRSSTSSWHIPPTARLGSYRVTLDNPRLPDSKRQVVDSGSFRVEEFRVPLVDARLVAPASPPVAPAEVVLTAQLSHLSGGAMAAAPLRGSALLRPATPGFAGYDDFRFEPPRRPDERSPAGFDEDDEGEARHDGGRLVADQVALSTDAQGGARFVIDKLPPLQRASDLVAEISFNDPNGEVQTVASTLRLWPSAVVLGIKTEGWATRQGRAHFTVLALDTAGKPLKGRALEVHGRLQQVTSTRKRLVGGFYAYDNRTQARELGLLCSGRSDDKGLLACEATLAEAGEVELVARARDGAERVAEAAASVWVTGKGELWFAQDNHDRIELLPEKKRYEPGETARLQVRMPFREATALVAVEREGVIDTRVVRLRGDDPTVELPVGRGWAPNVYVSVLVLRGRVRDVPWHSFFQWGWKEPVEWARAFWYEGREYQAPTAMVDLARPAFKLGVVALPVGLAEHELQVRVLPDKAQYPVRGKALVRVQVSQGGKPLPGAEVAFAAVDEGLLALRDNESWLLLAGMLKQRAWGVQTATAQSEVIGRRHYGRKAVAAGGSGGRGAVRELFDTLLLWQPAVQLDAKGEALIEVPLNDSLTSFRLVAVADAGVQQFGSGSASIRVTQDLQMLSGLPPRVREGDRYSALFTVRNTTAREMKLRATLQGTVNGDAGDAGLARTPLALPAQDLVLPAGGARELVWPVTVPAGTVSITWAAAVQEQAAAPAAAADRLQVTQLVGPAVPLRVLQATLQQLDGRATLPVAAPADALPGPQGGPRGRVAVGLQPTLGASLPGIRRYFETYPFICLEQKTSKAVGLGDAAMWATVANELGSYLDSDGLASYYPPGADSGARGSDRLTAYLLAATHEAGFELPPAARTRMLDGLVAFVEGRIERRFWSPRADLDVRKLAAIEALARHGRAQPRLLGSINLTPTLWPTAAVIDWLQILRRVDGIPERERRKAEAEQVLRSRLTYSGTRLGFSTEESDFWWWLMDSPDANAARLLLAVMDEPGWKDELPRLVMGTLGRQRHGAWLTTTANLWGALALERFGRQFESAAVAGQTRAGFAGAAGAVQTLDWARQPQGGQLPLPWPRAAGTLEVTHQGAGKPWLTVQSLAAVPLSAPLNAGYALSRSVSAVTQKQPGQWSRGDVLRVRLQIDAQADMTWVVVSDPVPGGATLLGSGLGRDSAIATRGERREGSAWLAFEERGQEAWRAHYEFMPRGRHVVEYTLRLNNPGVFHLPPTRVEAMYAPESFGEAPLAPIEVLP